MRRLGGEAHEIGHFAHIDRRIDRHRPEPERSEFGATMSLHCAAEIDDVVAKAYSSG